MIRKRRSAALVAVGLLAALAVLGVVGTPSASAHPLGNASVNHYDGVHFYPDHLTDYAVEDVAEIPTLQRKGEIDADGDGVLSPVERAGYATTQCANLAAADRITVNGRRARFAVTASTYTERPGAVQLTVGRLVCQLTATVILTGPAQIGISDDWDGAGIGWHEITATATDVSLKDSPFPAVSASQRLLAYPNDLLTSPLDIRSGTVITHPGTGASTYAATRHLPIAGPVVRALGTLATAFNNLVGTKYLTVGVGLLAVLLSIALGAGHALLPGHGKTIMAAYLVGRRGRLRDVITVGATVTITHTLGVIILGLLISFTTAIAPTAAEQDLGIVSGLIIGAVGAGLLLTALRRRPRQSSTAPAPPVETIPLRTDYAHSEVLNTDTAGAVRASAHRAGNLATLSRASRQKEGTPTGDHPSSPPLSTDARDSPFPENPRSHHGHHHSHEASNAKEASNQRQPYGTGGLIGLGVAGGLVPSPSALLVLLAAIALGRTIFGLILVLGYGLGMAAALTAAGLLLVRIRHRLIKLTGGRRLASIQRLLVALPILTAGLVLTVGVLLTIRALEGL